MWFGESEANVRDVFDKVRMIMSVITHAHLHRNMRSSFHLYRIAQNFGGVNFFACEAQRYIWMIIFWRLSSCQDNAGWTART